MEEGGPGNEAKCDSIESLEGTIGVNWTSETHLLLCPKHYVVLYRQLNTVQACVTCGVMPKQKESHSQRESEKNRFTISDHADSSIETEIVTDMQEMMYLDIFTYNVKAIHLNGKRAFMT